MLGTRLNLITLQLTEIKVLQASILATRPRYRTLHLWKSLMIPWNTFLKLSKETCKMPELTRRTFHIYFQLQRKCFVDIINFAVNELKWFEGHRSRVPGEILS